MKQLVIIGAGGFGREILGWARQSPGFRREWEIAGFLDDRPGALDPFPGIGLPVLGNTRDYQPAPGEVFICAVGNPGQRAELYQRMLERGAVFTRIVHESCLVGRGVELEPGVVLCPRVVLTCDLVVGENSALNIATAAGHDVRIGPHCQISSFCDLTGHVELGARVFMGSRASVIPSRKVGDRAVVGAGAVVVADVPPDVTVFGNPARILTRHP